MCNSVDSTALTDTGSSVVFDTLEMDSVLMCSTSVAAVSLTETSNGAGSVLVSNSCAVLVIFTCDVEGSLVSLVYKI